MRFFDLDSAIESAKQARPPATPATPATSLPSHAAKVAIVAEVAAPAKPWAQITRYTIEQRHPAILTLPGDCCISLSDVLNRAMPATANDPGDWPDLLNRETLQAFAQALLADSLVKPIPPATPATQSTNRVAGVAGVAAPTADLPLLADDHRHIDAQLCRHPRQRRTAILNEYRRVWLAAAQIGRASCRERV